VTERYVFLEFDDENFVLSFVSRSVDNHLQNASEIQAWSLRIKIKLTRHASEWFFPLCSSSPDPKLFCD
jgi:hypothetical protein